MKIAVLSVFAILFVCAGYMLKPAAINTVEKKNIPLSIHASANSDKTTLSNSAILNRKQIPVLCYHQIRDWRATDSKRSKDYIVPVNAFKQQLKMLAESGYHTISPDELYDYLTKGAPLPSKPVMLTYDDTDLGQFTVAYPEMQKYNFKGLFFIVTVSLNRANYMSRDQVEQLSDAGN